MRSEFYESENHNAIEHSIVIVSAVWPAVPDSVLSYWHQEPLCTTRIASMKEPLNSGLYCKAGAVKDLCRAGAPPSESNQRCRFFMYV